MFASILTNYATHGVYYREPVPYCNTAMESEDEENCCYNVRVSCCWGMGNLGYVGMGLFFIVITYSDHEIGCLSSWMTHAIIVYSFVLIASLTSLLLYMIISSLWDCCDCISSSLVERMNILSSSLFLLPLIVSGAMILFTSLRSCHTWESWFSIGIIQFVFISWLLLVSWWIGHMPNRIH